MNVKGYYSHTKTMPTNLILPIIQGTLKTINSKYLGGFILTCLSRFPHIKFYLFVLKFFILVNAPRFCLSMTFLKGGFQAMIRLIKFLCQSIRRLERSSDLDRSVWSFIRLAVQLEKMIQSVNFSIHINQSQNLVQLHNNSIPRFIHILAALRLHLDDNSISLHYDEKEL